jgi:hypothetical protein
MTDSAADSMLAVLRVAEIGFAVLSAECALLGLSCRLVADGEIIPGSYWGDSEAGLVADSLYVRLDTPLHSALHEASHYVCMDGARRAALARDAGGNDAEENAVCYLQILWAARFANMGSARMQADMDRWGYSFRLGSAAAWFERDAADARTWLLEQRIIAADGRLTGRLRDESQSARRVCDAPGGC